MTADVIVAAANGVCSHYGGGSGWWMGGMGIWMVIYWAAIIAVVVGGIVWLFRLLNRKPATADDDLRALEQNLAEGGISLDEFRERRAALKDERSPANENGAGSQSKGVRT